MNELTVLEHNSIRVMTTEQLAEAYGCRAIHIQQNFKNNRARFVEGKHYFKLEGADLKAFKDSLENIESVVGSRAPSLILWTKQGAARHSKIYRPSVCRSKISNCKFPRKHVICISGRREALPVTARCLGRSGRGMYLNSLKTVTSKLRRT